MTSTPTVNLHFWFQHSSSYRSSLLGLLFILFFITSYFLAPSNKHYWLLAANWLFLGLFMKVAEILAQTLFKHHKHLIPTDSKFIDMIIVTEGVAFIGSTTFAVAAWTPKHHVALFIVSFLSTSLISTQYLRLNNSNWASIKKGGIALILGLVSYSIIYLNNL